MSLLQIRSLSHSFGGLKAVDDFNLELHEDEIVGLIGPNGAGKSTVFNLICGLYKPSQGKVSFKGNNLVGRHPYQITSLGIGRTFQNIRLWNELPVLHNLRIARSSQIKYSLLDSFLLTQRMQAEEREIVRDAMDLLTRFGLTDFAHELPTNLSYGVQRRVEICRALVMKPRLLLLDEPAAGMNPGEVSGLMDLIRWVKKEFSVTIWIIEHQMRVIMGICDRIKVIDFGRTIAEGTPSEIRNNPKVIEAYLGEEAE